MLKAKDIKQCYNILEEAPKMPTGDLENIWNIYFVKFDKQRILMDSRPPLKGKTGIHLGL